MAYSFETASQEMLDNYLQTGSAPGRIRFLRQLLHENKRLPMPLVKDLMYGKMSSQELVALISACDTSQKIAFEDFVTRGIYRWDQNVASIALRLWAEETDGLLWHRTLPLANDDHILQRVTYTLLDLAWYGAGRLLLETLIKKRGLREMSPAFWALFYNRSIIWNYESEALVEIGLKHINSMQEVGFSGDKIIPHIVAYFLKFRPEILEDNNTKLQITGTWGDIIKSLQQQTIDKTFIRDYLKIVKSCQSDQGKMTNFYTRWPSAWHRQNLATDLIRETMNVIGIHGIERTPNQTPIYEMLGGIPSPALAEALLGIEDDGRFAHCLKVTGNLILPNDERMIFESLTERLQKTENPLTILEKLPQKIRIKLGDFNTGVFKEIKTESEAHDFAAASSDPLKHFNFCCEDKRTQDDLDRHRFIAQAYELRKVPTSIKSEFWSAMVDCWLRPEESKVDELSKLARQAPAIYTMFYIETLGRFQGVDKAALKLLDFVRSEEPEIIALVIAALSGIGTQRATQEIVAFLTRPNITFDLQMDISQILREKDLSNLQSEIRSAIDDVFVDPHYEHLQWELKATLSDLLQAPVPLAAATQVPAGNSAMPTSAELDQLLSQKLKDYHKLSSEAKRALRTAQFFHLQVGSAGNLKTIDLSPAIDMQYKALELSFRENFEGPCSTLINDGILQRKLDVIGYARPIKPAMDKFEDYIERLPVISDIPFFSRFKLRKMLRALCQYRRGKRFTLDGLKAFGLFFVCFSRKECTYGLANLFPVTDWEDHQLAEFVTILHTFQDFRNRAAHEGFHPDASNNLDAIWDDTVKIVESMFRFKENLLIDAATGRIQRPTNEKSSSKIA